MVIDEEAGYCSEAVERACCLGSLAIHHCPLSKDTRRDQEPHEARKAWPLA
uniref:Uncharacterized protein n=1 Tax=Arundo donax TaxID=35708 RepID=A0A0A9B9K1_ARUDO